MNFIYPPLKPVSLLDPGKKRLLIAAYGSEDRTLGWSNSQSSRGKILSEALMIKYEPEKGHNKIKEVKKNLIQLGIDFPEDFPMDVYNPYELEDRLEIRFGNINYYEEIILDVSSLTKLTILIVLCKLIHFKGVLRIIYSEAMSYSPSRKTFHKKKDEPTIINHFPSEGFGTILRARCLSSIRMQGQPVCLVAFTSFNEQLIRHMLGTMSPHRLLLINGKPPRKNNVWREEATHYIYKKLLNDYPSGNDINPDINLLARRASTLHYYETIQRIDQIYEEFGLVERIIIAATGSKMQTVGLFFSKIKHLDIHIEYPTPDTYNLKEISHGVRYVHEIEIPNYHEWILKLSNKKEVLL
jgi:hypothetical protein